ncbi:MAG: sarcosine oxidase subunit gamma [Candidatus Puniceispirillaceae bacterium]
MIRLEPTTALGNKTPFDETIGGIRIAEIAAPVLASLAMRQGKALGFRRAAAGAFAGELPAPGTSSGDANRRVIWMGPDQYLVEGMAGAELADAFGANAAVTDQSDAWAGFEISGATCVSMLERLCSADSRRMTAGDATRTPMHHMHCVLVCRQAGTEFVVYGPRSAAASLHHALCAAAASL